MMISTRGRYGLMAMVDMAMNPVEEYIPLKVIADRQRISPKYLEHLFSLLKKANLVRSVKGHKGGYSLSRKPSNIAVGEILRVLEGELSISRCCEHNVNNNIMEICIDVSLWQKVDKSINSVVDSITLEQLVIEYKKFNKLAI